jgi:hypothetical protein
MNQFLDHRVSMDIQVIHCKKERPPGPMSIQPIAELQHEIEELPQVSSSLCVAPVEGERLACSLIARNGHKQTDTPFSLFILTSSVASLLPRHLTKFPVLHLQFIIALAEVNNIPHALTQSAIRILSMPVLLALEQIKLEVGTVRGGRRSLANQPKPLLRSDYL